MRLTPSIRKVTLTVHVTASVGWIGALAVFMAHAFASWNSQDAFVVRAAAVAMALVAWVVILPLSIISLITGMIQALGTAWGLFRHYWVVAKLALTMIATGVLLLKLGPISYLAEAATNIGPTAASLIGLKLSMIVHAAGGLVFLLAAVTLAIYKPPGMLRSGTRVANGRQHREDATVPRWVKVFGTVLTVLALLIVAMLVAGGHDPGFHVAP